MSARAGERGSTTLAVAVLGALLVVAGLIGSLVGAHVLAVHHVRVVADVAALAAAESAVEGHDDRSVCDEARRVAALNDGRVIGCEVARAGYEVAVRVEAGADVRWTLPGLPAEVSAVSYAGNPDDGP